MLHLAFVFNQDKRNKSKADQIIKALFENCNMHNEYNSLWAQTYFVNFEWACLYAIQNKPDMALEQLEMLTKRKTNPVWLVNYLTDSPLLENIRHTKKFNEIVSVIQKNYQKERQKTIKVLEESNLLKS
jgi:hypothetical protein